MKTRLFPGHLWRLVACLGLVCLLAVCSSGNAKSASKPTPALKNAVAQGGAPIDLGYCLSYGTSDAPYQQPSSDGSTPALWYDGNGGPALQTVYDVCERTITLIWSTDVNVAYYEVFWFNLHSSTVPPPTYDVHVSGLVGHYTRYSVNSGGLYAFSVRVCRFYGPLGTFCWPWSPTVLMAT